MVTLALSPLCLNNPIVFSHLDRCTHIHEQCKLANMYMTQAHTHTRTHINNLNIHTHSRTHTRRGAHAPACMHTCAHTQFQGCRPTDIIKPDFFPSRNESLKNVCGLNKIGTKPEKYDQRSFHCFLLRHTLTGGSK